MPYYCDNGDSRKIKGTFTNSAGALANPTTVTLYVKDPYDVVTTPSVTNPSTGVYEATQHFNAPGVWLIRWLSDTAFGAAIKDTMTVARSGFE